MHASWWLRILGIAVHSRGCPGHGQSFARNSGRHSFPRDLARGHHARSRFQRLDPLGLFHLLVACPSPPFQLIVCFVIGFMKVAHTIPGNTFLFCYLGCSYEINLLHKHHGKHYPMIGHYKRYSSVKSMLWIAPDVNSKDRIFFAMLLALSGPAIMVLRESRRTSDPALSRLRCMLIRLHPQRLGSKALRLLQH